MLRHVLRVPKNSSLRKEDETETKPTFDWRQFQPTPSPSVVFLNSDSMRHTQSLPTIQEVNEVQETRPSELRNDIRLSIQGPAERNNLFPAIEDQG
jgi:hypothetical protein